MWKSIAHNDRYGPRSAEFANKNMDGDVELSRNVARSNEIPVERRESS